MGRSSWSAWARRGLVLCVGSAAACQGVDEPPRMAAVPGSRRSQEEFPLAVTARPVHEGLGDARRPQLRGSFYGGVFPEGLAVADFNGDGAPEVVVSASGRGGSGQYELSPGSVQVLRNDGHGGLSVLLDRHGLRTSSGPLVTGDVNGDGLRDVVVGTRFNTQVLLGRGGGSLGELDASRALGKGTVTRLGLWSQPDGRPLLWTLGDATEWGVSADGPHFFMARASSDQAFEQWEPLPMEPGGAGLYPLRVAVGDFNEDGQPDAVFSEEQSVSDERGLARVFLGQDGGKRLVPGDSFSPWGSFRSVYTADFNQDGHADLLALDAEGRSVSVLLGTGEGSFMPSSTLPLAAEAWDVAVVDLDPDGVPDVVALHAQGDAVSLLRGRGDGGFTPYGMLAVGRWPSAAVSADLDGDGRPELLVAEASDNAVSVYTPPNVPLESAVRPVACPLNPPSDGVPTRPAVSALARVQLGGSRVGVAGDFDVDGQGDLAVGLVEGGVRVVSHTREGLPPRVSDLESPRSQAAISLVAGDFDGDGRTDLAGVFLPTDREPGNELYIPRVLWNEARAPFASSLDLDPWWMPSALLAGDFNGDGLMDFATASMSDYNGSAYRMTNLGERQFRSDWLADHNPSYGKDGSGAYNTRMVAADFNGDGTLDILRVASGCFSLNLTASNGTTLSGQSFCATSIEDDGFFVTADADGDGQADLVKTGWGVDHPVELLRGDGHGSLRDPLECALPRGTRLLAWEDFNADGTADAVSIEGEVNAPTLWVMLREPGNRWRSARPYVLDSAVSWVLPVDLVGDARPELAVMLRSGELRVFPTPEP